MCVPVCLYIYLYEYMCVCVAIYKSACVCICMHKLVFGCIHICICTHVFVGICVLCVHVFVCWYTHVCACTCMYVCMCIHVCTSSMGHSLLSSGVCVRLIDFCLEGLILPEQVRSAQCSQLSLPVLPVMTPPQATTKEPDLW
jgi:hypothetical protein